MEVMNDYSFAFYQSGKLSIFKNTRINSFFVRVFNKL
jgi:hypothetical protein